MDAHTWTFLYLADLLLISWAMGCLTICVPRLLPIPRGVRFLVGFASAPFLVGAWMLLASAVMPGAPRWAFLMPPFIAAALLTFLRGRRTLIWLFRSVSRSARIAWRRPPLRLAFVFAAVLTALVLFKLVAAASGPLDAHDALVYLSEASLFAGERTVGAANTFTDRPDGTLRGNWHNFVWPAFLSHALMHTDAEVLGYPNDGAVRAAFQATVVYALLSLAALAGCARLPGVTLLSLPLILQIPLFTYLSNESSRDGFRIVPLLLLAAVLTGLSAQRLRCGFRWLPLGAPLLLAVCCVSGHALGGLIAVLIAFAWGVWGVMFRAPVMRLIPVLAAIAIGLCIGSAHHLSAYIQTGNFKGSLGECGIARLPEEPAEQAAQESMTRWARYDELLRRDQHRVSVAGLLCAGIAVAVGLRSRRSARGAIFPFFGLTTLAVALPFLGVLDFGSYPLSEWFLANPRYQLHWYPFAVVTLGAVALFGAERIGVHDAGRRRRAGAVLLAGLIALVSITAVRTVYKRWHVLDAARAELLDRVQLLSDAISRLPPGKRLLLEDARYNYYLANSAMLIFSRSACDILTAKNPQQVREVLHGKNIGVVALEEESLSGYWNRSRLLQALSEPETAVLTRGKGILLYRLCEDAAVPQRSGPSPG
jgi:hypothetical protein